MIISSTKDPASINIQKGLLSQSDWDEIDIFNQNPVYQHKQMNDLFIISINDRKINHENIDIEVEEKLDIEPKQAIFISRHTSKTGQPTLTTHPIGNYGKAELGGKSNTLIPSSPKLMSQLIRTLKKNSKQSNLYHKVCLEVTHHGPYLSIPTLFIEVGSTLKEWNNIVPCNIVAKTMLNTLESYHYERDFKGKLTVLIGIGGGHYAPRFSDVVFEKKVAFGHMIPSYHLKEKSNFEEMFKNAIDNTPDFDGIYIHRKALKKSQITLYRKWFEDHNIKIFSSKELPSL